MPLPLPPAQLPPALLKLLLSARRHRALMPVYVRLRFVNLLPSLCGGPSLRHQDRAGPEPRIDGAWREHNAAGWAIFSSMMGVTAVLLMPGNRWNANGMDNCLTIILIRLTLSPS